MIRRANFIITLIPVAIAACHRASSCAPFVGDANRVTLIFQRVDELVKPRITIANEVVAAVGEQDVDGPDRIRCRGVQVPEAELAGLVDVDKALRRDDQREPRLRRCARIVLQAIAPVWRRALCS